MSDQADHFREILLEHGHHPHGEGLLEPCDAVVEGTNAETGDTVKLTVRVRDGVIAAIGFKAQGSSVLRASCSLLVSLLEGMPVDAANARARRFMELLRDSSEKGDWSVMGDAEALRGIRQFPARVRCAILPWRTFAGLRITAPKPDA